MAENRLNKTSNTHGNDKIINRAEQVRRDNDKIKTPAVTIYDCDFAILSYLQDVVKPTIIENSQTIDIPILFANGEKWVQEGFDDYYADGNVNSMFNQVAVVKKWAIENNVANIDRY
mgnify:CR=1 FL=1